MRRAMSVNTAVIGFVVIVLAFCLAFAQGALVEVALDLHRDHNEPIHHTNFYRNDGYSELPAQRLIVRRGQPFMLTVDIRELTDGQWKSGFYRFKGLRLRCVDAYTRTEISDAPYVDIPLFRDATGSLEDQIPLIKLTERADEGVVDVYLPPNAFVGIFGISVVLSEIKNQTSLDWDVEHIEVRTAMPLIVLFNAWNKKTDEFLPDEKARQECVLNDQGMVFAGMVQYKQVMYWSYDQFDQTVLDVVLKMLEALPNFEDRRDVEKVARIVTQHNNFNDDNGLLEGKWEPPFWGGVSPHMWSGSGDIFRTYRMTGRGVRFGQCWNFAGVLTTSGRALGIPSRTITCYNSAHESGKFGNYENVVDIFFDPYGSIAHRSGTIWNFHQWVEFHIRRRELNATEPTWQAVDATPQEMSTDSGLFVIGPADKGDIKRLDRNAKYDTDFIISEITSRIRKWVPYPTGGTQHPSLPMFFFAGEDPQTVGNLLATRSIKDDSLQDITSSYKDVVVESYSQSPKQLPDVNATIHAPPMIVAGKEQNVLVNVSCPSCEGKQRRYAIVTATLDAMSWTGEHLKQLKKFSHVMAPDHDGEVVDLKIDPSLLAEQLNDYASVQYSVFVRELQLPGPRNDSRPERVHHQLGNIIIKLPAPDIRYVFSNKDGGSLTVAVSYENPILQSLSGAEVLITAFGFTTSHVKFPYIAPRQVVHAVAVIKRKAGKPKKNTVKVIVKIQSNKLAMAETAVDVVVRNNEWQQRTLVSLESIE